MIFHPSAVPAATKSGSSPTLCAGAPSCWALMSPGPTRPHALDVGEHIVQHLLLVHLLVHLHHPRLHRACSPVPAVALRRPAACLVNGKMPIYADLSVKVAVCVCVPAQPPDGRQEHHLLDVRLVLDLVDRQVLPLDQSIPPALFVLVEPFFVHHGVVHDVEGSHTTWGLSYPAQCAWGQPPSFAGIGGRHGLGNREAECSPSFFMLCSQVLCGMSNCAATDRCVVCGSSMVPAL